jgi:DNA-binding response OmpR family regulator
VFRRKLLVVEHDGLIQRLLDIILSRAGFEVDFASDGNDAWPKILQGEYAAIILDLLLPEMDGFHIVDRLAAEAPALLPRIILATAADDNTVAKVDTSRIHALIRKPFDIADLTSVVTACAERYSDTTAGQSARRQRGGLSPLNQAAALPQKP